MQILNQILHGDIAGVIQTVGYVGIFLIIFAESGLIVCFYLPGASLLFTAGLLASQGFLNIWILIPLLGVAAILGDNVGYWFGAKVGSKLFTREDSRFFRRSHVVRAQHFFARYGSKAVLLARFVPIIRTFVPVLAGIGMMDYKKFMLYNIIGGLSWSLGVSLLGYFLGNAIPGIEHYLIYIILLIIFVSFIPLIQEFWKARRSITSQSSRL